MAFHSILLLFSLLLAWRCWLRLLPLPFSTIDDISPAIYVAALSFAFFHTIAAALAKFDDVQISGDHTLPSYLVFC